MTVEASSSAVRAAPVIAWRQITEGLWVGRIADRHAGIIERGRRYTFTDPHGRVQAGFATFTAAQDAAVGAASAGTDEIEVDADDTAADSTTVLTIAGGLVAVGAVVLGGLAFVLLR